MWLALAFCSAALLGLYDVSKKQALKENAVLPVLWFNTLMATLLFLPLIIAAETGADWFEGTILELPTGDCRAHGLVFVKSVLVLSSWLCGYFGLKHLPLTIVGPINATRPILVLLGAMLLFGERLNGWQWIGVTLGALSLFLLSRSSQREGIDFCRNRWIGLLAAAALLGAMSGLYDRYIMRQLNPVFVQSWYNLYQLGIMTLIVGVLWWPKRHVTTPFHWSWAIPLIAIFLSMADLAYLYALRDEEAMISVVSMIRRSSVVVSFGCGALLFHEKNLKTKALDLLLILIGMCFLYIGSR